MEKQLPDNEKTTGDKAADKRATAREKDKEKNPKQPTSYDGDDAA